MNSYNIFQNVWNNQKIISIFTWIRITSTEYGYTDNIPLHPKRNSDNIDSIPMDILFPIFNALQAPVAANYHRFELTAYYLGKNYHVHSELPVKISWTVYIFDSTGMISGRSVTLVTSPATTYEFRNILIYFQKKKWMHFLLVDCYRFMENNWQQKNVSVSLGGTAFLLLALLSWKLIKWSESVIGTFEIRNLAAGQTERNVKHRSTQMPLNWAYIGCNFLKLSSRKKLECPSGNGA